MAAHKSMSSCAGRSSFIKMLRSQPIFSRVQFDADSAAADAAALVEAAAATAAKACVLGAVSAAALRFSTRCLAANFLLVRPGAGVGAGAGAALPVATGAGAALPRAGATAARAGAAGAGAAPLPASGMGASADTSTHCQSITHVWTSTHGETISTYHRGHLRSGPLWEWSSTPRPSARHCPEASCSRFGTTP